ncbi:MAG: hypothetical protein IIT65_13770 [Lachnospiraceae bacterium]|nr:hypothetical protein [Lachnospiraceae bacterium]
MKDRQATAYEQASQILKLQDEIFELKQKLKYAEYRISIMTGASNFEQSE